MKPLAIELYAGLHGWGEGLVAEGFRVVGFDIVDMCALLGHLRPEGCELVLQDVLTLHGSQFADAVLIVGSPPCQGYSYRAMPWKRAKSLPPPDNSLFNACFRIQREASEAAGRYIPLIVENVRGAQKWTGQAKSGQAKWHFGSYYLWGDVPALMPPIMTKKLKTVGPVTVHQAERYNCHINEMRDSQKVPGLDWNGYGSPDYKPKGFNVTAAQRYREDNPQFKQQGSGREWFAGEGKMGRVNSKSDSRKAASALIAKIPFPLAQHIAKCFKADAERLLVSA